MTNYKQFSVYLIANLVLNIAALQDLSDSLYQVLNKTTNHIKSHVIDSMTQTANGRMPKNNKRVVKTFSCLGIGLALSKYANIS